MTSYVWYVQSHAVWRMAHCRAIWHSQCLMISHASYMWGHAVRSKMGCWNSICWWLGSRHTVRELLWGRLKVLFRPGTNGLLCSIDWYGWVNSLSLCDCPAWQPSLCDWQLGHQELFLWAFVLWLFKYIFRSDLWFWEPNSKHLVQSSQPVKISSLWRLGLPRIASYFCKMLAWLLSYIKGTLKCLAYVKIPCKYKNHNSMECHRQSAL